MQITMTIYDDAKPDEAVRGCFAELCDELERHRTRVIGFRNACHQKIGKAIWQAVADRDDELMIFIRSIVVECKPRP